MPFKFIRSSKAQSLISETKERVREEISMMNDHELKEHLDYVKNQHESYKSIDSGSRWWVPSKNHPPDLTSTGSQFFAAQFTGTGPIQAKHAGIKKALQRFNAHEGWAE